MLQSSLYLLIGVALRTVAWEYGTECLDTNKQTTSHAKIPGKTAYQISVQYNTTVRW